MPEIASLLTGVSGRLLFSAATWIGKRSQDAVSIEFSKACALALDSGLRSFAKVDDELAVSVLRDVMLAAFEGGDLLGDVLIRPLVGEPLPGASLRDSIFDAYVQRGGDPESAPVDIKRLIGIFVDLLPASVRLVASEPGSALLGFSIHAAIASREAETSKITSSEEGAAQSGISVTEVRQLDDWIAEWSHSGYIAPEQAASARFILENGKRPEQRLAVTPEDLTIAGPGASWINLDGREFRSLHAQDVAFVGVASFENITVAGPCSFINCSFASLATFAGAQFLGPVSFRESSFSEPVEFSGASFASVVSLVDCVFERGVTFGRPSGLWAEPAQFGSLVVSTGAAFGATADFGSVRFRGHLDAERLLGAGALSFAGATFDQGGNLSETEVLGVLGLARVSIPSGYLDLSGARVDLFDLEGVDPAGRGRLRGLESVRVIGTERPILDSAVLEDQDFGSAPDTVIYAPDDVPRSTNSWQEPAYVEVWDKETFNLPSKRTGPD
jgi:hypothetical protein